MSPRGKRYGADTAHYDPETETFIAFHGGDTGREPSRNVVETVAVATDTETTDLRPLYEVVDPEALDGLFATNQGGRDRATNRRVTFGYEGCTVAVHGDGRTVVSVSDDSRP